jgi:hypothetical protein
MAIFFTGMRIFKQKFIKLGCPPHKIKVLHSVIKCDKFIPTSETGGCLSTDVWIFKNPLKKFEHDDIKLGLPWCDPCIVYQAHQAGLTVINPCLTIKCYHLHQSTIRHWKMQAAEKDYPFLSLQFSTFDPGRNKKRFIRKLMKKLVACILLIISFHKTNLAITTIENQKNFYANAARSSSKFVLGARKYGFFSDFINVLNHLAWASENNISLVVYWDKTSRYFVPEGFRNSFNAWEYYFYQVSAATYKKGDTINRRFKLISPQFWCINPSQDKRITAKKIIDRFIHIKPEIKEKIEEFYSTHMKGKKVIGIHWRGTDKKNEAIQVPIFEILDEANKHASEADCFLVASDEALFIEESKKILRLPVIVYDCFRSTTTEALHLMNNGPCKALLGEDVLIETQLLSRCNLFIHTYSNVSLATLYFNPFLKNIFLSKKIIHRAPNN